MSTHQTRFHMMHINLVKQKSILVVIYGRSECASTGFFLAVSGISVVAIL
jgi:hypothetical protein